MRQPFFVGYYVPAHWLEYFECWMIGFYFVIDDDPAWNSLAWKHTLINVPSLSRIEILIILSIFMLKITFFQLRTPRKISLFLSCPKKILLFFIWSPPTKRTDAAYVFVKARVIFPKKKENDHRCLKKRECCVIYTQKIKLKLDKIKLNAIRS